MKIALETFYPDAVLEAGAHLPMPDEHEDRGAWVMVLGGATLEGPRDIWWTFVASSKERIEAAKEDWQREAWGRDR